MLGVIVGLAMMVAGWTLAGWPGQPEEATEDGSPESAATAPARGSSSVPTEAPSPASETAHGGRIAAPEHEERIIRWREALASGSDPRARQGLALALLAAGQFYEAHTQAETILAESPEDVDGLYVSAAVRLRMGQPSRALPLLEELLERRPNHVPALVAKGQALERAGHPDLALAPWRRALGVVGGENREIEALIRSVESSVPADS